MQTEKQELTGLIDWVQVTFKYANAFAIMTDILKIDPALMQHENTGRFRYAGRWTFGGIEILTPPADYLEMGFHLYMTGSACRVFEIYLKAQNRTWFDFFKDCLQQGGKFTRLDIAIDDRNTYFTIDALDKKIKEGNCISKFHKRKYFESTTINGEPTGKTINLGSRESLCFMVFYEKNYEQSLKTGIAVEDYGEWNRYEIRLRKEMATACVQKIVSRQNICDIGLELINSYVRIIDVSNSDSNRSRHTLWKPWADFVEGLEKLELTMQPAPRTLKDKKRWVETYVAPTLKMIQLADEYLHENTLQNILNRTVLKPHELRIVEDFLIGRAELEAGIHNEY